VRLLLRIAAVAALCLAAAAFGVWLVFRPPQALPEREPGARIEGVTVVEPGRARTPGRTLVIEGDRIARVEAAGGAGGPFAGAFALPGLVDMHVHLPPAMGWGGTEAFGFLFLAHGVTSIREVGSLDGTSFEARRRVREGEAIGPRIFACGGFVDGPPPTWPNTRIARDAAEGRAAVEALAAEGADCIKAYQSLSAGALRGVREAAREKGLPVVGHVPHGVPYEEALLDDAQHLIGVPEKRVDAGLDFDRQMRVWDTVDAARIREVVDVVLEHDLANTPTLVVLEHMGHMDDYASQRRSPQASLLPRFYRDVVWHPQRGLPFLRRLDEDDFEAIRNARAKRMQVVKALHDAGARLHVGTDVSTPFVIPGVSMHEEMRLLHEAGIPAEDVFAMATRVAGASLGEPDLGTLAEGAPADVLLFREDPTRDLAALATLEGVVAGGRLYTRDEIEAGIRRWRAHYRGWAFDRLSMLLGRLAVEYLFDS